MNRLASLGIASLCLALSASACDQKTPAAADAAPNANASASASPSAAPSASATASAAPSGPAVSDELSSAVDLAGEEACVPRAANAAASPTGIGSSQNGIAFCLGRGAAGAEHGCFALDLSSGKYKKLPKKDPPKVTRKTSASGTHTIDALDKAVLVCPRGGMDCKKIELGAYRSKAGAIPADVSPDGKKLVVAREGGGEGLLVDIYDVATGARDKRSGIKDKGGLVGSVAWLGQRVLVVACVDAGPGCSPQLFDPETAKANSVAVNVYGVDRPFQRVSGSTWAFVGSTGGEIALSDVDTGAKKASFTAPLAADVESGVAVIPRQSGQIAIVGGAHQAGTVVVVDLEAKGKLIKKYTPQICK